MRTENIVGQEEKKDDKKQQIATVQGRKRRERPRIASKELFEKITEGHLT